MRFSSLFIATAILAQVHAAETKGYHFLEDKATLPLFNPSLAQRKVAKIQLENGLQAYLISDPAADQSAAALSVEAGSWQDPKEYPGMAHFLEHMLFMGTATYPKEFEYMQYITDHGGKVNASTWPDHTIYMFSINNDSFEGALDRFSHFFIDPLFSPSCINRELHAVDQEHAKNIEHDGWREYMIYKETGNPAHPNSAFSTGNAQTLGGIPQEALKKWYNTHYSAQRMHLVVVSPLPLDSLISLTLQDFSKVPRHAVASATKLNIPMSSTKQQGHIIYIKPVKDLRRLTLAWELPYSFAKDNERAAPEIIAYVLKNSSDKSLLEELKREKIAEDLEVTVDRFSKDHVLFRIDISLTEKGVGAIDTAATRCFQALARLRQTGIPEPLFQEIVKVAKLGYQHQSRQDAFQFITESGNQMLYENLETFPEKTRIPTKYDPAFFTAFLNTLTPKTCLFFVIAEPELTGVNPSSKEKWMQAEYTVKEIPSPTLLAWNEVQPNPAIDLPPANPFVPSDLALVEREEMQTPRLFADEEGAKIYFYQDNRYLTPEVALHFGLKSPLIDGSAKQAALLDLYIKSLTENLSSTLFFANAAGLNTGFSSQNLQLHIEVSGFSAKAPDLVKRIFQSIGKIAPTRDQFEIYKESLVSHYDNANHELPVSQAMELLSSVLYKDAPRCSEKLSALLPITYEEFLQFSSQLFKKGYTEGLLYGNLTGPEAQTLWSELKEILPMAAYPHSQQEKREVLILPEKQGPYMIVQNTERQGHGVVLVVEEGPFSFENRAIQQVLATTLRDAFFDTLRTKQQTAYIAKAWDSEVERQLLQFFAIQSSTHHPSDLISRFEIFLEDFTKNLDEKLPNTRFETVQKNLIHLLQMPPENMQIMGLRLNLLAFTYEGDFSWYDKRIAALQKLTYDQVKQGAALFLSRQNSRRLAVLVEGILPPENDFRYERISQDDMRTIGKYVTLNNE